MDRQQVSSWRLPALFALFIALWLLSHPYWGIMHDAVLYSGQALRSLYPENFARDVFFLYGSQDDYTLFSPIYASLIEFSGLGEAAMLVTLFGALLWCYAVWRVSASWHGGVRWLFLFLLAVMPLKYGGNEIFGVAESYAVPRLWADALTLLACALWLEKRFYWSLVPWVLGVLMHPLMAMAGALFVVLYELRFTWRWGVSLLAGTLAVCCLALLGVPLFARLFQVMDAAWFDLVYQRTSFFMFPTAWTVKEYNSLGFHAIALLWAAWLVEDNRLKRVFLAACATGLLGLLVAIIGGDWLRSVLMLQVQPWRTLWLMYVFGWGAVAWLVTHLWRSARFVVLGLAAAWILREYSGAILLLMVFLLYWQKQHLSQTVERLIETGLVIAILFHLVWMALDAGTAYVPIAPEYERSILEQALSWRNEFNGDDALLTLAAALLAYWIWRREKRAALGVLFVFIVFLSYGKSWDMRSHELKNLEANSALERTPFNRHIPKNATVYWLDGLQPTWLLLGRSSYYSRHQSAGLVFSRPLAMEIYRRHMLIKKLDAETADLRLLSRREAFLLNFEQKSQDDPLTLSNLRHVCADRELDFVILPKRFSPWMKAAWFTPYTGTGFGSRIGGGLYLYACEDLRKNLPARD